jgi:hypothetical protein
MEVEVALNVSPSYLHTLAVDRGPKHRGYGLMLGFFRSLSLILTVASQLFDLSL